MTTDHVSAFRPWAGDPLLSDGDDMVHPYQFPSSDEARSNSTNSDIAESLPGYFIENNPSYELSFYIPDVPSVAAEHVTPLQFS